MPRQMRPAVLMAAAGVVRNGEKVSEERISSVDVALSLSELGVQDLSSTLARSLWSALWRECVEGERLAATDVDAAACILHLGYYLALKDGDTALAAQRLQRFLDHPQADLLDRANTGAFCCDLAFTALYTGDEARALDAWCSFIEGDDRRLAGRVMRTTRFYLLLLFEERDGAELASEEMTAFVQDLIRCLRRRRSVVAGVPVRAPYAMLRDLLASTLSGEERDAEAAPVKWRRSKRRWNDPLGGFVLDLIFLYLGRQEVPPVVRSCWQVLWNECIERELAAMDVETAASILRLGFYLAMRDCDYSGATERLRRFFDHPESETDRFHFVHFHCDLASVALCTGNEEEALSTYHSLIASEKGWDLRHALLLARAYLHSYSEGRDATELASNELTTFIQELVRRLRRRHTSAEGQPERASYGTLRALLESTWPKEARDRLARAAEAGETERASSASQVV
jgi:hypothetical protein